MTMWRRFKQLMDRALEFCTVISFTGMILVVSIQVFSRFLLPQAPHWTEEASRILFIYTGSFAAGLAVKSQAYVAVDSFVNLLPPRKQLFLNCGTQMVITAFMFLTAWLSITFVRIGATQMSSSLRIPMNYVFASIFVMTFFIGFYSLIDLGKKISTLGGAGNGADK
jgi:TRAP-type C4-dicarboxylate transport system permease small subunit